MGTGDVHKWVIQAARSTEAQDSVDADASEAGFHGHSQGLQESPPARRGKENAGVPWWPSHQDAQVTRTAPAQHRWHFQG